jgi:tRNA nucleotidyltransferase/poly(A) polymerase
MTAFSKTAEDAHGRSIALMKFLSGVARRLGAAEHIYVVGGAVRNFVIGQPIKDIDVVVDSIALGNGRDSAWFAQQLVKAIPARTNFVTNQYGVAILSVSEPWDLDGYNMKGEVIEIANARKESYGGAAGKGYKPSEVEPATIHEDLSRREFTFNTLLWRLLDLEHGPERAEIIDLTGLGKDHLEQRLLSTPLDPDKTFSDDPTRLLRAVKFVAKYKFNIAPAVAASIQRNAPKLKQMPWDAVRKILTDDILGGPAPRESVRLLSHLGLADVLKEMMGEEPGFAAALGRSLNDTETHLLLDMLDLGWTMKTPLSFLNQEGQTRLRTILLEHAADPAFERTYIEALRKPPVDQMALFTRYNVPAKERQVVTQIARGALLENPDLSAGALNTEVEKELQQRYEETPPAVRVAGRYLLR